ncbi:unnamed protein product [Paramecium pentaurelia]|uniref:Uncharacterized protein n=1 Tax=Paramecium pentaurelia TaxID=43138 RepID=A0A8S1SZZ6_9CILI|nr:unnamed protein product [Paramecium pentaurelia]
MNNKFIILSLLLALVTSQTQSLTLCACSQLLSGDCIKMFHLNKTCGVSTTPVTPTVTNVAYCDKFAETDCPKAKPCTDCGNDAACAWVQSKCIFFTGCTPFAKTLDSECQAISNRCITDGTHCVEIDACSTYKKQLPCVKNAAGTLCYWDTTNNSCVDANNCDKLPATFETDKDCRDVISTCTKKPKEDVLIVEITAVIKHQKFNVFGINQKKLLAIGMELHVKIEFVIMHQPVCQLMMLVRHLELMEHAQQKQMEVVQLELHVLLQQFKHHVSKIIQVVIVIGQEHPVQIRHHAQDFQQDVSLNQVVVVLLMELVLLLMFKQLVLKNSSNFDCIWDTTCKEKTCANAPTTNNTHDLCTSYLSTCTVKSCGGCQNRTCANVPTTMTTNDACEAYFTGNNCITKTGSGCVTNTTCAAITLEAACVKNSSASTCFWNTASSSCKDKTCVNAPATNTTHDLCQAFLNTCTVNQTSAGFVQKKCENSFVLAICDKDTSSRACIWNGKCYKKQCVLASSATTTHADCQTYHSTCTLSNSGTGSITIEAACNLKANGQPCGWNGSQCINKACSTASKTFTTTSQCTGHISTCVANNPVTVNGSLTIQGCQDLPTTCADRKSSENCEITRVGFPTCLWVSSSTSCVEKSCATASTVGTTGALSAGGFTLSGCQTYLNTCISNNTADGCIAKPSSCSSLVSSNCRDGSKASGDCYWNGVVLINLVQILPQPLTTVIILHSINAK